MNLENFSQEKEYETRNDAVPDILSDILSGKENLELTSGVYSGSLFSTKNKEEAIEILARSDIKIFINASVNSTNNEIMNLLFAREEGEKTQEQKPKTRTEFQEHVENRKKIAQEVTDAVLARRKELGIAIPFAFQQVELDSLPDEGVISIDGEISYVSTYLKPENRNNDTTGRATYGTDAATEKFVKNEGER